MRLEGGCYCRKLRYVAEGEPIARAQCHCRECQYITGGSPNVFFILPADGFRYVKGEPKSFKRGDIDNPATRQFCAECGTHIASIRSGPVVLKVGTLDDPKLYDQSQFAIHMLDKQSFHQVPQGIPTYDRLPPR